MNDKKMRHYVYKVKIWLVGEWIDHLLEMNCEEELEIGKMYQFKDIKLLYVPVELLEVSDSLERRLNPNGGIFRKSVKN